MIQFKINGKSRQFDGDPDMPLLWYLRDEAQMTGTKFGCGIGQCGACTVLNNGKAVRSCVTTMKNVENVSITTIEGLSKNGDHRIQKAWREVNVPQCGYCQSGQMMQAVSLLTEKPKPTDQEIDAAMQGNICRCGTYQRIRQAIHVAAGVRA
jgi:isoquinoline 1-oxidoreductase alpha subunit